MTPVTLTPEKRSWLDSIEFCSGGGDGKKTFCVEQAVAYLAGEPITDHPECACPVIAAGARRDHRARALGVVGDRLAREVGNRLLHAEGLLTITTAAAELDRVEPAALLWREGDRGHASPPTGDVWVSLVNRVRLRFGPSVEEGSASDRAVRRAGPLPARFVAPSGRGFNSHLWLLVRMGLQPPGW